MDETRNAALGRDPGDPRGAFRLHGPEIVAAALVEGADAVDHRIGTGHGGLDGGVVADVAEHRLDLAHRTVGAHEQRLVRPPHGDTDAPTLLGEPPGNVTAE